MLFLTNLFRSSKDSPSTRTLSNYSILEVVVLTLLTWVLVGHVYTDFMGSVFVNNMVELYGYSFLGNRAFVVITNVMPSVDSFFLIGSTILAFITLKELDKTNGGNVKFWVIFYVHRYIRLTGIYAMIIPH